MIEHSPPHAPHPTLVPSFSRNRTSEPLLPVTGVASGTSLLSPTRYPLLLGCAEYHARYAKTHPPLKRESANAPAAVSSRTQKPKSAKAPLQRLESERPSTPPLSALTASLTSVVFASFFTSVLVAQSSPKSRKSRPRKRRVEAASSSQVSAAKQATTSRPVVPHPATRAALKSTTAASSSAIASSAKGPSATAKSTSAAFSCRLESVRASAFA